jgi:polyhydroxyalkanoate synthesis regulator phasin
MLEKLFFTGLGAAALLKDKVESEVKTLEEKGKIKTDDAKSFLESIESKGKEEDEKLKNEIKKIMKEVIDELGLVTKDDLNKLKEELK